MWIVGWVWSVYWSYLLVVRAYKDQKAVKEYLSQTEMKQ